MRGPLSSGGVSDYGPKGRSMKFAIAVHGTRGDVEPCVAVGLELIERGHEVVLAVPPNLVSFAETAGLAPAIPYGEDSQEQMESAVVRDAWKLTKTFATLREGRELLIGPWAEMGETLASISRDADLILTGTTYQEIAANVGESRDVPVAALHYFPLRPNSRLLAFPLPARLKRSAMRAAEWAFWRVLKGADDAQRRQLGLPKSKVRSQRRIVESGTFEIQAYDEALFPGLDQEWGGRRPFVGSITMGMPTDSDDEVATWITAGSPPIFFGLGSTPVDSPRDVVAMITAVCAELGERALICVGSWELPDVISAGHVKIVPLVNFADVFPACRTVVHHAGAGTTAAGMRAGVPTLALWSVADQPIWANSVDRLGVGVARRLSKMNHNSLRRALRTILAPEYAARARAIAPKMTEARAGVLRAADLLEEAASVGRSAHGMWPDRATR